MNDGNPETIFADKKSKGKKGSGKDLTPFDKSLGKFKYKEKKVDEDVFKDKKKQDILKRSEAPPGGADASSFRPQGEEEMDLI